jgi:hypothetical protein
VWNWCGGNSADASNPSAPGVVREAVSQQTRKRVALAGRPRLLAPHPRRRDDVGNQLRLVDDQQRAAVDAQVAPVGEQAQERLEEPPAVVEAVALLDQQALVAAVPAAGPVLVGPAHAEREVGRAAREHRLERPLEQSPPVEPVEVVAEGAHAVLARERDLPLRHARGRQGRSSRARRARAAARGRRTAAARVARWSIR